MTTFIGAKLWNVKMRTTEHIKEIRVHNNITYRQTDIMLFGLTNLHTKF